ncbi:DNA polymerase exonuclease subunit [Baekduia alba]|nr:DNA polymerase exonuclease subunit [Baekduia alba]
MEPWVAVDFETASSDRASACAVAAVAVADGAVVDERRWLIRPPGNKYDAFNTFIHGIDGSITRDASEFSTVWSEVLDFAGGRTLVAHNAGFDMGVVRAEHVRTGATPAEINYVCSLVMARRQWTGLPSYSLPWVCDHVDVVLADHHDPLADARACAEVMLKLLATLGTTTLSEAAERLTVFVGSYGPHDVRCTIKDHKSRLGRLPENPDADPDHPLYGMHLVFTGTLQQWRREDAARLAVQCGAICANSVTRSTDYLVCGISDPRVLRGHTMSTKLRKATAQGVELLTELEFTQLL